MKHERAPVRLFIIAAAADAAFQTELEKHVYPLWQQGLLANWQSRQLGEEAEGAFSEARLIVLLLSADFSADSLCQEQMQRALERQREGEVKVLPMLLRPAEMVPTNGQAVTLWANQDAAWAHITESIRCVLEGKPLPVVQEQKEAATYAMENQVAQGPVMGEHNTVHQHFYASASPPPAPTAALVKPIWMVPYARNPFFTGRNTVLDDLHQRFKRGQAQAVSQPQAMSGLGGIGKTQIAVEYAYRYRQEYQQVLWVSAETAELLTSAYTQIATKLDLPEKEAKDQEISIEAVKQWLAEHQHWLLILDNAGEPEGLEPFLPPMVGGQVLVTTRASDLTTLGRGFGHALEVETFTPEQGALFLLHRAGVLALDAVLDQASIQDRQRAIEVSEELDGLPLALDQAGAYLSATHCTLTSYQELYQTQKSQLLKERRSLQYHDSVATTWQLSFERVEATNSAAVDLLRLCSFLAPDAVAAWMALEAMEWLRVKRNVRGWSGWWQERWRRARRQSPMDAERRLNEAIEALQAYSLLKRERQTGTLSMHRLVQTVLRDAMGEKEEREWKQQVIAFLSEVCPDVSKVEQWPLCEQWVPHVVANIAWLEEVFLQTEAAIQVYNAAGYYLLERGRYQEVELLYRRALEIGEQELGPEYPDAAVTLSNVAISYLVQGKYTEAELLLKRALAISEQEWGLEHPDTAHILNNLAELYRDQGKHMEAELLLKRALAISEQEWGLEHPDTSVCVNNLARLYQDQGKYTEAEPLMRRVLEIDREAYGADHPVIATDMNNLAALYQDQGKYTEAEPLYKQALAILEQELGLGHLDTGTILNNIAMFYQMQGKYTEAELLYKRVLILREKELGPRHLDIAHNLNDLGVFYYVQGKYIKAESLLERALEINEQELGPGHPDTANSLNNLALLYYEQGRYEEAESLLKRAITILQQRVGPQHPNTKLMRENYAGVLRKMGREEEVAALDAEGK